jgi:hypothetical protein
MTGRPSHRPGELTKPRILREAGHNVERNGYPHQKFAWYANQGAMRRRSGQTAEAIHFYEEALRVDVDNHNRVSGRATGSNRDLYEKRGDSAAPSNT